jgi:hypothetical protein
MRLQLCLAATVIALGLPAVARAQVVGVPFGNSAIFEPEVDVVNSGVVMDAQATVSADRKYVTLTMRTQQSDLLALRTFNFQNAGVGVVQLPGGVVGGVNPVGGGIVGGGGVIGGGMIGGGNLIFQRVNAPMRTTPGNGAKILTKRGITPLVLND